MVWAREGYELEASRSCETKKGKMAAILQGSRSEEEENFKRRKTKLVRFNSETTGSEGVIPRG